MKPRIKEPCSLIRGITPVYYWIGNPFNFITGKAGDNVKIQKVFTEVKFNRFVLDLNTTISEFDLGSHEYIIQDIDLDWILLRALGECQQPIVLSSALMDNIDLGLIYIDDKDISTVSKIRESYFSLKYFL